MKNKGASLIFEKSKRGLRAMTLPFEKSDVKEVDSFISAKHLRETPAELPEVGQLDVLRHYSGLADMNFDLSQNMYPLGSCTMKYNPVIHEDLARLKSFADLHPYQPIETVQGTLEMMYDLAAYLSEITGMAKTTLQPAAGAHGELTGLLIIKKFHEQNHHLEKDEIIIPDSAHGTNPASAVMAGFRTVEIASNEEGMVDLDALKAVLSDRTAGLMLTNPNTLGIFEKDILEIASLVHEKGGLLYYDGANMNAIMGKARPGDMGFDVVHLNLHKTFSTPHGGGGPGSGPVGVCEKLIPYLPGPGVEKRPDGTYDLVFDESHSIGRVKAYYGHVLVLLRAYAYILALGKEGLKQVSEQAVLNANYLKCLLSEAYEPVTKGLCMHEFVLAGLKAKISPVSTLDVAKGLLDAGYHPPTIYFPLIVPEAMMVEPTESESKDTLDDFAKALKDIAKMAEENPEKLKSGPHTTRVGRLDETQAARKPIVRYMASRE